MPSIANTALRDILRKGWCILLLGCALDVAAQFGNEWIQYDQPYWMSRVSADGVYRLSFETLQEAGFPVGSVDPQQIRMFTREEEIPVVVAGESDASFDPGDYIEWYGRKNDGWLDSLAYDVPWNVLNPWYSLFNDTSTYFLTIGPGNGLRTELAEGDPFLLDPSGYCWRSGMAHWENEYLPGRQDPNGISLSWYGAAEGWTDVKFPKGASSHKDIPTPNVYSGEDAPQAIVNAVSASASLASGNPNHHLQVGWGNPFNLVIDTVYYGYQRNHFQFTLQPGALGSTTRITHRSVDDLGVAADNHAVAWISIEYPANYSFSDGDHFRVTDVGGDGAEHIAFTYAGQGTPRLWVMGLAAEHELALQWVDGAWHALLVFPPGAVSRELKVVSAHQQASLERVTLSGYFTDYSGEQLEEAFVIVTHPSLMSASSNYAAYRQSQGTDVLLADVEELYLQYGGGVAKHPLAIRRFCKHLLSAWDSDPAHLFLIGKSIHEMKISSAPGARNNSEWFARNLVPTWGWPSSDQAFTAGLSSGIYDPAIPTGRLAANNGQEVLEYLNKVIEHEAQPPAAWQKRILHFGGGSVSYEQNLFNSYLAAYRSIAEDTSYAAEVFTFLKNTSDPIQLNLSDSIQWLINEGVALMTFFGHASSTGFDQNIDSPESYDNQGRYPLLIGNSCYTGNIHLFESQSTSEEFVLVPNRGVIGFMAKSDLGIPNYLDLFTSNFYRNSFQEEYGKSIGQCMAEAIRDFQVLGDYYRENTALTFCLHGDPSVRLFAWDLPDYEVAATDIWFDPATITSQADSFAVHVTVHNIGKAIPQPVGLEVIRHYPDGTDSSYVQIADAILHDHTYTFTLPIDPLKGVGQNTFDVWVDYPTSLQEEMEEVNNNVLTAVPLFISSGDLIPVFPARFAVVPDPAVTVFASTGYALEPSRTYVIQADTTDTFDSPFLLSTTVTQQGGVVEWTLPVSLADSTVVFWRCSADSTDEEHPFRWRTSSFQYIAEEEGWGQDHFFQFDGNQRSGLDYDRSLRQWDFAATEANLKCEVYGSASTQYDALATRYQLDLEVQEYSGFGFTPSLMVAVIDPLTLEPWESNFNGANPGLDFGNTMASAIARNRPERYFIFQQNDAAQLAGFADMVQNEIPEGHYLLIYTWQFAQYANWETLAPEVFDAFAALGAQSIGSGNDSIPFIFFQRYGDVASTLEIVGGDSDDYIVLETPVNGSIGSGVEVAPLIGPADSWGELSWDHDADDDGAGDAERLEAWGVTSGGNEVLVASWDWQEGVVPDLGALVDASQYPRLRLRSLIGDSIALTPPQLDRWHVLFEQVPEAAVDPSLAFWMSADTVREGEALLFACAVRNISPWNMDSLLVEYRVQGDDGSAMEISYPRRAPLLAGETLLDTVIVSTAGMRGWQRLTMEVNPFVNGTTDQPEQSHFNNIVQVPFLVTQDDVNPLLDVTFDGQHILNGDIVSPEPLISIRLDDDNPFLLLSEEADTAHFRLYLTAPGESAKPIFFSDPAVSWFPATSPANRCRIEFAPVLDKDGLYTLLVQANDKSGNASGAYDYRIDFEVIQAESITEVLNYPNPFSTSTRFVFTLTGSELPDEMKIQIMTVGGDIVREITQDELGPLRIGRNLTEYAWDGRDEYGDQLANGVYLYRVVARLNGQPMEVRPSGASPFISNGFGKMYLMR